MAFKTTGMAAVVLLLAPPLDPVPTWTFTGPEPSALLGHAVAGLGDVNGDGFDDAAVGLLDVFDVEPGEPANAGRTFVFAGSPAGLSPTPLWTFAEGGTPSAAFDVNGDGFDDLFVRSNDSKAFLFLGSPYGLLSPPATTIFPGLVVRKIVGLGDTTGDGVGDAVLINAPPTGTQLHLFRGSVDGLSPIASFTLGVGDLADVAAAGDVNGDGLADLVYSTMSTLTDGRAVVQHGSPNLTGAEAWQSTGEGQGGFGTQVAGAGDVDGDGFDDLLVSAPHFSAAPDETGKVYLFRGSASGLGLTPSWTFVSGNLLVGARIASAGDVNADGYSDVALSSGGGVVLLFLGSAAGLSLTPDQTLTGGSTFGWSLASAGDVDGDGASELVVGDPFEAAETAGRAFLFSRPPPSAALIQGATTDGSDGGCGALGVEAGLAFALAWLVRKRRARWG
jgi:hypothetical protein